MIAIHPESLSICSIPFLSRYQIAAGVLWKLTQYKLDAHALGWVSKSRVWICVLYCICFMG